MTFLDYLSSISTTDADDLLSIWSSIRQGEGLNDLVAISRPNNKVFSDLTEVMVLSSDDNPRYIVIYCTKYGDFITEHGDKVVCSSSLISKSGQLSL